MKKTIFLGFLALSCGLSSLSAQVGINTEEPKVTLDIVASKTDGSTAEGVIAPRLTGDQIKAKDAQYNVAQKGAIVYATAKVGTASTKTANITAEGYYYFDGSVWVGMAVGSTSTLKITTQPAKFTFSRLLDAFGDPNAPASFSTSLTVAASGGTTPYTYQWKRVNDNRFAADANATGTSNAAAYSFSSAGSGVGNWGLYRFYCIVTDATGTNIKSDIAEIALGTGAKTTDGRWLKFAAHNLGADRTLPPFTYSSIADDDGNDIKGDLYQWGRYTDGHEKRNSTTVAGPVYLPTQYQVPSSGTSPTSAMWNITAAQTYSNFYGKFITANNYDYFYDWRTPQVGWNWYSYGANGSDPCYIASGGAWQLPTHSDWASIIGDNSISRQSPANATANVWTWATGYALKPDGSTTTLFLPAAGHRHGAGTLDSTGSNGDYWSSTASASAAFGLHFNSGVVVPGDANYRADGRSVRCVQNH